MAKKPVRTRSRASWFALLLLLLGGVPALAQSAVDYRISFPAPQHHWMQVEVLFSDLPPAPLRARMSRSSPGRYALHEFAKNVFDLHAFDGAGKELPTTRPDPYGWDVPGHNGTVRISYRVFGDRADGTYLGIDSTHARMNMPASLIWAKDLERRPARIRFESPAGAKWRVASQLFPTDDPFVFTAPNLQYLMDSPVEFSAFSLRTFNLASPDQSGGVSISRLPIFRIALHHDGTEAEFDAFQHDVVKIIREALAVFGEFPSYENSTYTFLSDYLPYVSGDGMEHRNSTSLTANGALRNPGERKDILGTVAHEFFHCWNVERIRPRSLEPFDFDRANISGELWLGEGFTSYYDALLTQRAGITTVADTADSLGQFIDAVTNSPGRLLRSAEEMSQLAPFVDAARSIDRTYWDNTFISYYTWGAAIGLGLDLSLRDRTNGRVTLDDFMRAMWVKHGKPDGPEPGLVAAPYTMQDVRDRLAEVSGDRAFADDFVKRYVQGHETVDYARLLARAGFSLRKANAGKASLGGVRFNFSDAGARLTAPSPISSPAYNAGMDQDDVLVSLGGQGMTSPERLEAVLGSHRPGERLQASFRQRGIIVSAYVTLVEDPELELVPIEAAGGALTSAARSFREQWLGSHALVAATR